MTIYLAYSRCAGTAQPASCAASMDAGQPVTAEFGLTYTVFCVQYS
jgi:hypothetical protein